MQEVRQGSVTPIGRVKPRWGYSLEGINTEDTENTEGMNGKEGERRRGDETVTPAGLDASYRRD